MTEANATPRQTEIPLALVKGEPWVVMPEDLYIPPDALEVFLEAFEGPLDLLLYLIKRQNLDILDIPIAEITRQYMEYVDLMKDLHLELAAEYLVMAAMLAEIKSRLLLPRPVTTEEVEHDPRAELVRRLQEYEQIKQAAEALDALPQLGRDTFIAAAQVSEVKIAKVLPQVDLQELVMAVKAVLARAKMTAHHHVQKELLSIRERMTQILAQVSANEFICFEHCFNLAEGRLGVVVSFIAILELLKQSLITMFQAEAFSPIHIRAISASEPVELNDESDI